MRLSNTRSIGHDDRLSVVGHLDELRTRLIVSLLAFAVAFGVCFWQNHRLLTLIDSPLAHQTQQQVRDGHGPLGATYQVQQSAETRPRSCGRWPGCCAGRTSRHAGGRGAAARRTAQSRATTSRGSRRRPRATGRSRSGSASRSRRRSRSALIFALILALPVLLWQVYGFLIPALEPEQRRHVKPLALAVPGLFIAGVAFGYFVVLPAAVHFFQNFNSDQFNVLVQASQYYKFAATTMLAMGLLFQVPVAILAITRAGVITPRQLRRNRRYAIAACALVAARAAGRRDHDAARDGAAVPAVRGERAAGVDRRARARARGAGRPRSRRREKVSDPLGLLPR